MKFFFYLIAAALCRGLAVCGMQVPVRSSVVEVSLFRDGAVVTRQGSVQVAGGKTTLVFKDLPSSVDPTTLQPRLMNDDDGMIYVRNAKIHQPNISEEKSQVQVIQEKLDEVMRNRERQNRIVTEAKETIDFAKKMRYTFSRDFLKNDKDCESKTLSEAKDLADFVSMIHSKAYLEIDAAQEELKLIDKKVKQVEKELSECKEAAGLLSSQAEVEIEADAPTDITIGLTYLAEIAKWEPQYELRAHPNKGTLDFGYYAAIYQHTGEDWSDIQLSLHTNRVRRMGNVPKLRPLHVRNEGSSLMPQSSEEDFYERKRYRKFAQYALHADRSVTDEPEAETLLDQETTITESTVSFQAAIPGRVTVLSSRETNTYKVLMGTVEAAYWSETVPNLNLDAYLRAKIRNTLDIPILPGDAIAFVDGELSSKVRLGKILPKEEANVSLGVDGNVIVRRTKGALKDSNTGYFIIGETKTLSREYISEVTNLHTVDHTFIVVDQWPIAREEKIGIHRIAPNESEVVIEDENNGIFQCRNATLGPKEKKAFATAYDVIYPRDWTLSREL